VERYLTEIAKSYNVDYTSPPEINPEADAIDLMLIDPPYNSKKGGGGGGGGGGRGLESTSTDWKYTPAAQPQPMVCTRSPSSSK